MRSVTGTVALRLPGTHGRRSRSRPPKMASQRRELVGEESRADARRRARSRLPIPTGWAPAARPRPRAPRPTPPRGSARWHRATGSPRRRPDRVTRTVRNSIVAWGASTSWNRPSPATHAANRPTDRQSRLATQTIATTQGSSLRWPADRHGPWRTEREQRGDQRLCLADGQRPQDRHREHAGAEQGRLVEAAAGQWSLSVITIRNASPDRGRDLERQQRERPKEDREERRVPVEAGVVGGCAAGRTAAARRSGAAPAS